MRDSVPRVTAGGYVCMYVCVCVCVCEYLNFNSPTTQALQAAGVAGDNWPLQVGRYVCMYVYMKVYGWKDKLSLT